MADGRRERTTVTITVGTVERAFQLAESGDCLEIPEIARQLKADQCDNVDAHLSGSLIRKQLREAISEAAVTRVNESE